MEIEKGLKYFRKERNKSQVSKLKLCGNRNLVRVI